MRLTLALLANLTLSFCAFAAPPAAAPTPAAAIPVILDTDIGDDIDDTWALVQILKSPQFDLKLVTTTHGKGEYRAKLIAKLLTVAKRTDVAVGVGAGKRTGTGGQQAWVAEYLLTEYPGKVHADGVQALIDTIKNSPQPVTVIAVGPVETLAEALERDPSIAGKANFAGMHGSVRVGYGGKKQADAEYNVKEAIPAAQKVLGAPWRQCLITPLDTCGLVTLSGPRFAKLKESKDELVVALLENYRIWAKKKDVAELTSSSTLFDTVAVYLAEVGPKPLTEIETLNIAVDGKGVTVIDPAGAKMGVATKWTNLDGYRDLLVQTLLAPVVRR